MTWDKAKSTAASWDDARIFLAVRRAGSHSAAGRSLGLNASTVGRRMAALEQALATRLFVRTPSGLAVTRAGQLLGERAERVEAEMLAGERELRGTDERAAGKVRLTASDGLATYVLVPALRALWQRHPDLRVERWEAYTALAVLEDREGNAETAVECRARAREEIEYLAARIGDPVMEASFRARLDVAALYGEGDK